MKLPHVASDVASISVATEYSTIYIPLHADATIYSPSGGSELLLVFSYCNTAVNILVHDFGEHTYAPLLGIHRGVGWVRQSAYVRL